MLQITKEFLILFLNKNRGYTNNFQNPYNKDADSMTKGGQYWYDKDVGYVRVHTESVTQLEVLICVKTPCGNKSSINTYHTLVTIDD